MHMMMFCRKNGIGYRLIVKIILTTRKHSFSNVKICQSLRNTLEIQVYGDFHSLIKTLLNMLYIERKVC